MVELETQLSILDFANEKGFLTPEQYRTVRSEVEKGDYYEIAFDEINITQDQVLEIKSQFYNFPGKRITGNSISEEVLKMVPAKTVELYSIIPLDKKDHELVVGFVNPHSEGAREVMDFITSSLGLSFKILVVTKLDFDQATGSVDQLINEVGSALSELEGELILEPDKPVENAVDSEPDANAAPVTKIVATIIRHAKEDHASDIHIEPYETETKVRFRVDGALKQSLALPAATHAAVVARVKILANLRIDEKRKPQDGRFSAHIDGHKIDFRVSTFPTSFGEKIVMRLLESSRNVSDLTSLGLSQRNLELIKNAIDEPYGLILISGPTGSGKSTTLYTMLEQVDRKTKNVLSLEDPVEYQIPGVSQSAVNGDIGYTFASGLRTVLRQDPDIIMVGEIRDKETAQLAVQAALTGHLVLSTIHTNSATGVIPRLVDMGVDPYLIAPTLKLAIGQRLIQKICKGTGRKIPIEGSVKKIIDSEFEDLAPEYRSHITYPEFVLGIEPTARCPKGTSGRQAVFEVMRMTREIDEILLKDPNEGEIYDAARRDGMLTMREDAILKAFEYRVPFEEINKLGVAAFNE
jgi:type IV pilus assembly protein PilB